MYGLTSQGRAGRSRRNAEVVCALALAFASVLSSRGPSHRESSPYTSLQTARMSTESSPAAPVASTSTAPPPPPKPDAPVPTPARASSTDAAPPSSDAAAAAAPTPVPAAASGAPAAVPAPTPTPAGDGLTQEALRKKLDVSRKDLRGYLDKKKRIDRELVSPLESRSAHGG